MKNGRPESFTEAIDVIIDVLNVTDKMAAILAEQQGKEWTSRTEMQQDLERLKGNLTPALDHYLYYLTFGDRIDSGLEFMISLDTESGTSLLYNHGEKENVVG